MWILDRTLCGSFDYICKAQLVLTLIKWKQTEIVTQNIAAKLQKLTNGRYFIAVRVAADKEY